MLTPTTPCLRVDVKEEKAHNELMNEIEGSPKLQHVEPEEKVALPTSDGTLVVCCASGHAQRVALQVASFAVRVFRIFCWHRQSALFLLKYC